uniref:Dynactin 3 (p22) n=2 Tax=Paramormyrops kingsleyae TaxID=1676925 RepID=A0A3B3S283_9TELE
MRPSIRVRIRLQNPEVGRRDCLSVHHLLCDSIHLFPFHCALLQFPLPVRAGMMEGCDKFQDLETRVQDLEKRVYGERGGRNKTLKLADSVTKIQTGLANTANKRERVKILHKKIEDLMRYLDPQFTDSIAVPDSMKLEFILAEEQFLLSQAALLEQVSNLQPLLDSSHIRAVPEHATRLQRLSQVHIRQQDQSEALSEEVKKQFEDYNKTMFLLSKQFTQWDESLRQLEGAKQVKPVD